MARFGSLVYSTALTRLPSLGYLRQVARFTVAGFCRSMTRLRFFWFAGLHWHASFGRVA